ncbi:hypothetical protein DPMN_044849 [Dreissena polymorpha]|uniref:Uncharacterized protein n=1 Tax=Dreissena polymorpha TaxID=45954 RepID=A0A9D4I0U7_DREPO|nr:hypothetical protein DPMN_044849 [Dreissena polymorpha]
MYYPGSDSRGKNEEFESENITRTEQIEENNDIHFREKIIDRKSSASEEKGKMSTPESGGPFHL